MSDIKRELKALKDKIEELKGKKREIKEMMRRVEYDLEDYRRIKENLKKCQNCEYLRIDQPLLYYCSFEPKTEMVNVRYCPEWKEEENNE